MKRVVALSLFAAATLFAAPSFAAPCAGFTDVDSADGFCPFVEWVKNRSITLGCGAGTTYCPNDSVLRIQMAAFLNRLGNALEPKFAHAAQNNISTPVNNAARVCVTAPIAIVGYPRVASPVGSLLLVASSSAGANFISSLVYSTDGGMTFSQWSSTQALAGTHANIYSSMSPTAGPVVVNVGDTVVFAIQSNNFAGQTDDAACELTVRLDSHTGASSPF